MVAKTPLVSSDWLAQHLTDPDLVVVDCRFALLQPGLGQQQYQESHIPGARYLDLNQDLSSPVQRHGGRHPLPDVASLATKLAAIGVSSQPPTLVVAYDDSRFAFAARLWWLLRYLGHDRVAVLDGGWSGWLSCDDRGACPKMRTICAPCATQSRSGSSHGSGQTASAWSRLN